MRFPRNARVFPRSARRLPVRGGVVPAFDLFPVELGAGFHSGRSAGIAGKCGLARPTNPTVTVAVDGGGELYFQNQVTTESEFTAQLAEAVRISSR
jgi:hypothetical protein